jgi:hypothetical protein
MVRRFPELFIAAYDAAGPLNAGLEEASTNESTPGKDDGRSSSRHFLIKVLKDSTISSKKNIIPSAVNLAAS